jgi:hypothetical protein
LEADFVNINYRWLLILIIIALLLIGFLALIPPVSADDIILINESSIKSGVPGDTSHGVIEVHQNDTIYYGDVCDLTLVSGWYDKVYNKEAGAIVDVAFFTRKISISRDIFPLGDWYQYAPFEEPNGNTIAFHVGSVRPAPVPEVELLNVTNETPPVKQYIPTLPTRHIADMLVVHGEELNITSSKARIWIFGNLYGYYGLPTVNGTLILNKSQIWNLPAGRYTLITDQPGPKSNTINMWYNETGDTISYFDPNQLKIVTVPLFGLASTTRLDRFREVMGKSGDYLSEYTLAIQDPYIEITTVDTRYIDNDVAAQTIKGYTNVKLGTKITLIVDKERNVGENGLRFSIYNTTAEGDPTKFGDMRTFSLTVPILWANYGPGHHTVEASTATGGSMSVDYNVYESPEHSFVPNNTIKYINGSEWRPDPTPIVIKERVTVLQPPKIVIKEVPVPPPQASVDAAQEKATRTVAYQIVAYAVIALVSIVVVGYVSWSYIRLRKRRMGLK